MRLVVGQREPPSVDDVSAGPAPAAFQRVGVALEVVVRNHVAPDLDALTVGINSRELVVMNVIVHDRGVSNCFYPRGETSDLEASRTTAALHRDPGAAPISLEHRFVGHECLAGFDDDLTPICAASETERVVWLTCSKSGPHPARGDNLAFAAGRDHLLGDANGRRRSKRGDEQRAKGKRCGTAEHEPPSWSYNGHRPAE